ncbi:hypothetical protein ACI3PL_23150, partial [Lacticaseibacillus paracasei]
RRLLQSTPHLVLLSRAFYARRLAPLMAEWMVFWLASQTKAAGVPDKAILQYVMERRGLRLEVLDDDFVKMLNLSADWVHLYLPFVLGK